MKTHYNRDNILFDLAEITPAILLKDAIYAFYPEITFLEDFVTDFNNSYAQALQINNDPNLTDLEKIEELSDEIEDLDLDVVQVIFDSLIDIGFAMGKLLSTEFKVVY